MKMVLLLFVLFASAALAAENAAPVSEPFPADRYASMKKNSPFALATAAVTAAETPFFARNFFVAGIAKIGETEIVTILNQDKQPFTLRTGEASGGIELISVEYSAEIGKSKVTIKKGAEFATLSFNEQVLRAPVAVTSAAPGNVQVPLSPAGVAPRVTLPPGAARGGEQTTPRRRLIRRPSQ